MDFMICIILFAHHETLLGGLPLVLIALARLARSRPIDLHIPYSNDFS